MQNKNPNSRFGIDLNEYTQEIDFRVLARTIDFLYLRSSSSGTGRFRVDRRFIELAESARNYGIPVGAYHYALPSADLTTADAQCDDFIDALQIGFGDKNYGDLFPVLDVEAPIDPKMNTDRLIEWVLRFKERFERKTRRRLMLYTGLFFIQLYDNFTTSSGTQPLKTMPLWIAMYTAIPSNPPYPPNAGGWTRWTIWQFSENQIVRGVSNPVDANWGPNNVDYLMQPRQVTGLSAYVDNGELVVTWNKSNDADLLGYNLFQNGYWIGTVGKDDRSFRIATSKLPVKTGRTTIAIEAFDADGETSQIRTRVQI